MNVSSLLLHNIKLWLCDVCVLCDEFLMPDACMNVAVALYTVYCKIKDDHKRHNTKKGTAIDTTCQVGPTALGFHSCHPIFWHEPRNQFAMIIDPMKKQIYHPISILSD